MLVAICCVLRLAMASLPNVKPITALFFVFTLMLGLGESLIVMALTMILTGLVLGFSPIIFGQIFVYLLIILIFKACSKFSENIIFLVVLAGLLAMLYGLLIDIFSAVLFGLGGAGFFAYWLAGLPFDLAHAGSTFIFYPLLILVSHRIKLNLWYNNKI